VQTVRDATKRSDKQAARMYHLASILRIPIPITQYVLTDRLVRLRTCYDRRKQLQVGREAGLSLRPCVCIASDD
jgi:hypothetical protein